MFAFFRRTKRSWVFLSTALSFISLIAFILIGDANYRKEKAYRDLQIKTFATYSGWNTYIGSLRGLLLTTSGFTETLENARREKEITKIQLDELRMKLKNMPPALQKPLSSFIGSIDAGLLLGEEIEENGWRFIEQPDLPDVYKEGRVGLYNLTGKDATQQMGPLSAYLYYQLVGRLKGMNVLFDQLFSNRLHSFLSTIAKTSEQLQRRFFIIRIGFSFFIALVVMITIFLLYKLNRSLRLLADNTQSELITTRSHLQAVQGHLENAQFQQSLFEMVAALSHELNTPLGNCVSLSSHLRNHIDNLGRNVDCKAENPALLEETLKDAGEGFDLIMQNLNNMRTQIDNFKRLSSINYETEGAELSLNEYLDFELPRLVEKTVPAFSLTIKKQNTEGFFVPYTYMNSILSQLISNSYRHGKVLEAELNCFSKGKTLHLHYMDKGKNLDPEIVERLAEPFFTTARGKRHMGLGLSIIASLISNKLKGNISFESLSPGLLVAISLNPKSN